MKNQTDDPKESYSTDQLIILTPGGGDDDGMYLLAFIYTHISSSDRGSHLPVCVCVCVQGTFSSLILDMQIVSIELYH